MGELSFEKFISDLNEILPFLKACSDKSLISTFRPAALSLQSISFKPMLCLIYPYRSWLRRPFGLFFTNKETEERCLNTEKRDRSILFTEIEKFYSPAQRRQGEIYHRCGWNQENNPSRNDIEYPDGCKSCQAQKTQFFPSKIKMKTNTVMKPIPQYFVFFVNNHFL